MNPLRLPVIQVGKMSTVEENVRLRQHEIFSVFQALRRRSERDDADVPAFK